MAVRREAENPVVVDPEAVGPAMGGPAVVGPAGSSLSIPRPVAMLHHSRRLFLSQECFMVGTITLSRAVQLQAPRDSAGHQEGSYPVPRTKARH